MKKILFILFLSMLVQACVEKHECSTKKGKKKKEFYNSIQYR